MTRTQATNETGNETMADWIETKTTQLLAAGRRSGYFADMIADAEAYEREGYAWDVALAKSAAYWATDPWDNLA